MAEISIPLLLAFLFASFATAVLHGAIGMAGGVVMAALGQAFFRKGSDIGHFRLAENLYALVGESIEKASQRQTGTVHFWIGDGFL